MITNEMKEACDRRKDEIVNDQKFQTWISDIRCSVNMYKNVQNDRIRLANQTKTKKTGDNQKIPDSQKNWKISDDQREFNTTTLKLREELEKDIEKRLKTLIKNKDYPIFDNFLSNITGLGAVSSAIILSSFRPENIYYVSNMFSYAGIVTGKDKLIKGQKATFDKNLKCKLLGVIGPNFIKLKSEYAQYYYQKRIHLINRDALLIRDGKMSESFDKPEEGKLPRLTAAHHSRMATRYMIQKFVRDYYVAYRSIMHIPVVPGYEESYLNLTHVGENFVDYESVLSWKNETKEERTERRQKVLHNIEEQRKVLYNLMIRHGYKEED